MNAYAQLLQILFLSGRSQEYTSIKCRSGQLLHHSSARAFPSSTFHVNTEENKSFLNRLLLANFIVTFNRDYLDRKRSYMKVDFSMKLFSVTNSIFSKTKTKSDMNQLVNVCFICKTKCKEPVSRVGVNIVIVLCSLRIVYTLSSEAILLQINDLHKDCLGSRRGKSRILAVVQVDRPGLVMQSRSCFSNTCNGLTRSAGSAEIKCASALKTKLRLFVFFICFER